MDTIENQTPRQQNILLKQLKTMIDTARNGEIYDASKLQRIIRMLSDDRLETAGHYATQFKGRSKAAKENMDSVRRAVDVEMEERYNAVHPEEAEQQAYEKSIHLFKEVNADYITSFDWDRYIHNHRKQQTDCMQQGLIGSAAVQSGIIRAAIQLRNEVRESHSQSVISDTGQANGNSRQPVASKGLESLPNDGRTFVIYGHNKGDEEEFLPMDIESPAFVDTFRQATQLSRQDLEHIMPQLQEALVEMDWQIRDARGKTYIFSHPTVSEQQMSQQSVKQAFSDRVDVFKMENGFWGVNETIAGVRSKTRRVSEADIQAYFDGLKGQPHEEVLRRRAVLAEKYLHSEASVQEQSSAKIEAGFQQKRQSPSRTLPTLNPGDQARITNSSVFRMSDGKHYAVRCKIDGEQHSAKLMKQADVSAFFDNYKGLPKEMQAERKAQVAALYFREELDAPRQDIGRVIQR